MNTLMLRLSGPMQSWGVQSRFGIRDTGLEPSKSGVMGLICAALGIPREDEKTLARLAAMTMGVRIDQEGLLRSDYHTAQNVLKAAGGIKNTELSRRYYLADAIFLAAVESEDLDLLHWVQEGLGKPVWPLFLGRKAFIPTESVMLSDGIQKNVPIDIALHHYTFIGHRQPIDRRLRLVYEDKNGESIRHDQPVSFSERRFAPRRVNVHFISMPVKQKEGL